MVFAIGAAAAAALSLNIWRSEMGEQPDGFPPRLTQFSQISPDPDDELTLALRQQARTAMTELEARRKHF
jgi:hypothetical protein